MASSFVRLLHLPHWPKCHTWIIIIMDTKTYYFCQHNLNVHCGFLLEFLHRIVCLIVFFPFRQWLRNFKPQEDCSLFCPDRRVFVCEFLIISGVDKWVGGIPLQKCSAIPRYHLIKHSSFVIRFCKCHPLVLPWKNSSFGTAVRTPVRVTLLCKNCDRFSNSTYYEHSSNLITAWEWGIPERLLITWAIHIFQHG